MKESESEKDEVIRVTTGSLKLPESITNDEAKKTMNLVIAVSTGMMRASEREPKSSYPSS